MTTAVKALHQSTTSQTTFRAQLLEAIFDVFNIPISPKHLPLPAPAIEVVCAGNTITEKGFGCDASLYEVIDKVCDMPVKGRRQAQHVVGVLQQALPGLRPEIGQLNEIADQLQLMILDIKNPGSFKWSENSKAAQQHLKQMVPGIPRAFCHPDYLVTENSCLIMAGDASDQGTGEGMWRVEIYASDI